MAKSKKELKTTLKLEITGGQATPAPPLGPILGQNGINIQEFCTQFNDKTKDNMGERLPVVAKVYVDGSFELTIKQPTVASMLKKAAKINKGSANPKREKNGKITRAQMREIAEAKLPDLNTIDIEAATNIVEGTANSLGLEIVG